MAYIGVSPSNGVRQKHTYTATASQTTFSGAGSEGVSLSYRDSNYVDVYVNGVKLGDADYTATSGTSIVLAVGAAVSDIVEIITYDVFSVADTVSKADGGTFDGNVAMAGTLDVTGDLTVDTSTLHVDSANNRVGVGTVSPDVPVEISVAGSSITNVLKLTTTSSGTVPAMQFEGDSGGTQHIIARVRAQQDDASNGGIVFETEDSGTVAERMRIDSSGNLLVGQTANGITSTGIGLVPNGVSHLYTSGERALELGRGTNDGEILRFNRSGTTVGSIGVTTGRLTIGTDDTGFRFHATSNFISPWNISTNGSADNSIDLGGVSDRFKDLYVSNSVRLKGATRDFSIQQDNYGLRVYDNDASSERFRIDASGNLLVGHTTAGSTQEGAELRPDSGGYVITGTATSQPVISLNRKTSDGAIADFKKDGSTVGSIGSNSGAYMYIGSTSVQQTYIGFNNNYVYPSDDDGNFKDNAIDLGNASARFNDIYLGGGVYLGGTGSANYLDDYEEGTWTPSLGGNTTYNEQEGFYRKVGSLVFVWGLITVNVQGTGSTQVISGLPFSSTREFTMSLSKFENSNFNFYSAQLRTSLSTLYLSAQTALDGTINTNQNYFQNNTLIQFSGSYIT